ncbi:MAG: M61 family metallopeptidase [Methanoregulaceae archaeon]|nr:M61 family metallopeptidase [Methanoregulaceae archaeon]
MNRILALALLLGASLGSTATYTFTANVADGLATVRIELGQHRSSKRFDMPAWAPGDYAILDYGQYVRSIQFKRNGQVVEHKPGSGPNTWDIPSGADSVEYTIAPSRGNFTPNLRMRDKETFISGPGVFGWFEGAAKEQQSLWLTRPNADWKVVSSLRTGQQEPNRAEVIAADYDELIDAPIVAGPGVRVHEFIVGGKPHWIVGYGQTEGVDLPAFAAVSKGAPEQALLLFGELPYQRYLFMFDFGGPGGGLEHRDSARMGISPRQSPASARGLIYHEYVHTFNVKRIRAEALGPFDYTKPAITGTLWWLEGVTDYYGEVFQMRAGHISRNDFVAEMRGTFDQVSSGRYLEVSADESSRRVWETRGSFGFGGISYYTKGRAAGALLDLAIRAHSGGKRSLDDVMRKLWDECKDDRPGYKDARIRELCVEFGGAALGPIYDATIMKAGPMPFAEALKPWPFVMFSRDQGFVVAADANAADFAQWPLPIKR